MKRIAALAVAALGLGTLSLAISPLPPAAAQDGGFPPVPVETAPVTLGAISDTVSAVGTLNSGESVIVRPEIAGLVTAIHFAEGTAVEKDALLFSLDDSVFRAELAEAEAALRLAQRNHERTTELFQRGTATARARDEAVAKLESDRAALELARVRLSKTEIRAAFAGIIGLRQVSVGDYVTPGEDLVNLEAVDPIKVDFRVPESALPHLAVGQNIDVRVDAYPGESFVGSVYALAPLVDPVGRSLQIRARIANPDDKLRGGLFARIKLTLRTRENALSIPEQAIVPRDAQRYVFKVVDGKAAMVEVEVGQRRAGQAEIVEGLAPGDVVVTAGQMKLRDGAPVRPVEAGTNAPESDAKAGS